MEPCSYWQFSYYHYMNRFNLISSFPKQHKQKREWQLFSEAAHLIDGLSKTWVLIFQMPLRRIKDRLWTWVHNTHCLQYCLHTHINVPFVEYKIVPGHWYTGSVRSWNLIFALEINRENVKSGKINSTSGLITDGLPKVCWHQQSTAYPGIFILGSLNKGQCWSWYS